MAATRDKAKTLSQDATLKDTRSAIFRVGSMLHEEKQNGYFRTLLAYIRK